MRKLYIATIDNPQSDFTYFLNQFNEWVKGVGNAREFKTQSEARDYANAFTSQDTKSFLKIRTLRRTEKYGTIY